MRIHGTATLAAPRPAVFDAICDPAALLAVIPGCESVARTSPEEYRGRISLRLPGIVGRYDTYVRLTHTEPPAFGAFEGRVEGRVGGVVGRASFRLDDDGTGTRIEYDGNGVVTGPLGRLDARFLEGVAASLVNEGLARLDRRLADATAARAAVTAAAPDASPTAQSNAHPKEHAR